MKKFIILAVAAITAFPALTMAQKNTSMQTNVVGFYDTKTRNFDFWYQGDVMAGYAMRGSNETDFSRVFVETTHGLRLTKYAFVGAGIGVQYAYGRIYAESKDSKNWNTALIPIFANIKAYCPIDKNWAPYVSLSIGGSIVAASGYNKIHSIDKNSNYDPKNPLGGGFCKLGIGLNYKSFAFDLGLMHQDLKHTDANHDNHNSVYFGVGYKF